MLNESTVIKNDNLYIIGIYRMWHRIYKQSFFLRWLVALTHKIFIKAKLISVNLVLSPLTKCFNFSFRSSVVLFQHLLYMSPYVPWSFSTFFSQVSVFYLPLLHAFNVGWVFKYFSEPRLEWRLSISVLSPTVCLKEVYSSSVSKPGIV